MSSDNQRFLLLRPGKRKALAVYCSNLQRNVLDHADHAAAGQREAALGSDDLIALHGLLKIQEHSVALRPGNYLQQVPGDKAFYRQASVVSRLTQVHLDTWCCHCRKGTSFDLAPLAGLNPIGLAIKPLTSQQLATFRFARVKAELEQVREGRAFTQHAGAVSAEAAPRHSMQGLCMFKGQDW